MKQRAENPMTEMTKQLVSLAIIYWKPISCRKRQRHHGCTKKGGRHHPYAVFGVFRGI